MKTCLICDDHALMRDALGGAVALGWPDAAIAEAADFPSAWSAAEQLPDLIVSDLMMPGSAPVDGIRQLRHVAPNTPVLVITGSEDDELLLQLFDLGIAGFVPKSSRTPIITAAIQLVLSGGLYLPPALLDLVARRGGNAPTPVQRPRLTPRQSDVLRLIAAGRSNKEIARELDLSPATIKAHTAAAIAALSTANRTEAVVVAQAAGLI